MSEINHITKCRFCTKEFTTGQPLAVPIIGEPPHANLHRYVQALAKHMQENHPQEWAQLLLVGSLFTSVLILRQYQTEDPALLRAEDINRFQVHQMTRRNVPPTDEALRDNLESHIAGEWDPGAFLAMKELRDYLIEAALFQPVRSQAS